MAPKEIPGLLDCRDRLARKAHRVELDLLARKETAETQEHPGAEGDRGPRVLKGDREDEGRQDPPELKDLRALLDPPADQDPSGFPDRPARRDHADFKEMMVGVVGPELPAPLVLLAPLEGPVATDSTASQGLLDPRDRLDLREPTVFPALKDLRGLRASVEHQELRVQREGPGSCEQ